MFVSIGKYYLVRTMLKMGRPSKYTAKLAGKILHEIATTSHSLNKICQGEGMPHVATVMRWEEKHPEFREGYARAKQKQAELLVDEMLEIADDSSQDYMTIDKGKSALGGQVENREVTNRSRLRVDTRKWIVSKLLPKKYGDNYNVNNRFVDENGDDKEIKITLNIK